MDKSQLPVNFTCLYGDSKKADVVSVQINPKRKFILLSDIQDDTKIVARIDFLEITEANQIDHRFCGQLYDGIQITTKSYQDYIIFGFFAESAKEDYAPVRLTKRKTIQRMLKASLSLFSRPCSTQILNSNTTSNWKAQRPTWHLD